MQVRCSSHDPRCSELPGDVLATLFKHLNHADLRTAGCVNSTWRQAASSEKKARCVARGLAKSPGRSWRRTYAHLAAHDSSWEVGRALPRPAASRQVAQLDWGYEAPRDVQVTACPANHTFEVRDGSGQRMLTFRPAGLRRVNAFLVSPGARSIVCLGERRDGQNFAVCLYCLTTGRLIRELGRAQTKRLELSSNGHFLRFDGRAGTRVLHFCPPPVPRCRPVVAPHRAARLGLQRLVGAAPSVACF